MIQSRHVVVIGQCAFTCRVVLECLKRGVRLHRVVIFDTDADYDPFPDLKCDPEPQWLVEHRFYHGGWRVLLKRACEQARVEHFVTHTVFRHTREANVLVVAGFAHKVPDRVLRRFGDFALNVHTSLLPSYRGPQPEAQVILHGETESGVSIHTMTSEYDSGPIRFQSRFQISDTATVGDLESIGAKLAAQGLAEILGAESLPIVTPHSSLSPSYFAAYDANRVLDLGLVASLESVMRMRPEGYAFLRKCDSYIYPIVVSRSKRAGCLTFAVGHQHFCIREWVAVDKIRQAASRRRDEDA